MTAMVLALVVGGCGPNASAQVSPTPEDSNVIPLPTLLPDVVDFEQALALFEYDRSVPFDVEQTAAYPRGTATFEDFTYMGANGIRMPAYLIVPPGDGPFAGVVWMGWTGGYSQIRDEYVEEALALADRGVVSLLVAGYFPWYISPIDKDADRTAMIVQVRELRRGVDLLLQQSGVDPTRVAFVGHSISAMHGASLVASDHRVKAAVLMAPHATMTDWIFEGYGLEPSSEPAYRAAMASFDPVAFVGYAAPSSLFFQFSNDDPYVPNDVARSLFGAASEPKRIGWYGGAHDLDDRARSERDAWLAQELELAN
jgi:dienelactone hydrolase